MTAYQILYGVLLAFVVTAGQAEAERVYHCPNPQEIEIRGMNERGRGDNNQFQKSTSFAVNKEGKQFKGDIQFPDEFILNKEKYFLADIDFYNSNVVQQTSTMYCSYGGGQTIPIYSETIPESGRKCSIVHEGVKGERGSRREKVAFNEIAQKCQSWEDCYVVCG